MSPKMLFIVSFAFLSLVAGDDGLFYCNSQPVTLNETNTKFEFHSAMMAPNQICEMNFTIPDGYLAHIHYEGNNLKYFDIFQVYSKWSGNFQLIGVQGNKASWNDNPFTSGFLDISWPPTLFEVQIRTDENSSAVMTVIIEIEKFALPALDQVEQKEKTAVNEQPAFMQLFEWKGNTSTQFTSSGKGVTVGISSPDYSDRTSSANFFVYDVDQQGSLVFRGTLYSLIYNGQANFFNSLDKDLIIYRSQYGNFNYVGTVVVNDQDNMQNINSNSRLDWSPYNNADIDFSQTEAINAPAGQIGFLTILNQADGENAIYFTGVQYFDSNGIQTVPVKVLAGGMVKDYNKSPNYLGTYGEDGAGLPQFLPGTARTFILEHGSATVKFTTVPQKAHSSAALNGRTGFIMSDNYPFNSLNQDSNYFALKSLNNDPFTFEYTVDAKNPNQDAYLNITLWGEKGMDSAAESNYIIDLSTLQIPMTMNYTAMELTLSINGGLAASTGTKIPYKIVSTADALYSSTTSTSSISTSTLGNSPAFTTGSRNIPTVSTVIPRSPATTSTIISSTNDPTTTVSPSTVTQSTSDSPRTAMDASSTSLPSSTLFEAPSTNSAQNSTALPATLSTLSQDPVTSETAFNTSTVILSTSQASPMANGTTTEEPETMPPSSASKLGTVLILLTVMVPSL